MPLFPGEMHINCMDYVRAWLHELFIPMSNHKTLVVASEIPHMLFFKAASHTYHSLGVGIFLHRSSMIILHIKKSLKLLKGNVLQLYARFIMPSTYL